MFIGQALAGEVVGITERDEGQFLVCFGHHDLGAIDDKKISKTRSVPQHAKTRPLELWWQDEARIGQQGTLAERGSRPLAPRDQRYAWAYLFGAICPARGTGAALVLPFANAEMMNLHLTEISGKVSSGAHALMVVDGAGWHQIGDKLRIPDNVTLLHP